MKRFTALRGFSLLLALVGVQAHGQIADVTQPGDPIIASSANSPGSEGVANAIDNQPTKYLNFDTRTGGSPSGFVVSPSIGRTVVTGITFQSANDAPERDPKIITIEGSNDEAITGFNTGNWELVASINDIPSWVETFGETAAENRFKAQTLFFSNHKPFKHYRLTVLETQTSNGCCFQIAEVELLGSAAPKDVTQPGDPLFASSANSPGSEGGANAIDNQPTKYLNFDTRTGGSPSGLAVSPSIGRTVVTGITFQSANDAPERDPKLITLEGSNDESISGFNSGTWESIVTIDDIPSWVEVFGPTSAEHRFKTQEFFFNNVKPYRHYRLTVLETQTANGCCFQIAEIELLGKGAPKDVTQPGDSVIASSANSPGSEGVANAIDNQPTKYLNFDTRVGGSPSGFVVTPSVGETVITGVAFQSANDGPERDPKVIRIEGSNDATIGSFSSGNWQLIAQIDNIPSWVETFGETAAEHRFKWQELFFSNSTPFKHYRLTVLETQTANTCCFQIAEVELLAVLDQADCNQARFLTQPVNTPVLPGSSATFFVQVNGPWPLQWFRNGEPIAGATSLTYTTSPVTAENANSVYTVQIVGCEMSVEVSAALFEPSAVQSIAVNFVGGGANGAPTSMNPNDVAGIHPQAYWNNASGGSGFLPDEFAEPPAPLVTSNNQATPVTFDFAASGTWGAGTGVDSATQRMLNGLVLDNPGGEESLFTFSNVPAGTHTVLVYVVSPPLQFQDVNYTVEGTTEQTYYIRAMNSDEYNAAPGFYRGSSTSSDNRTIANFVRFENVQPANGAITLRVNTITTGYDRGTGVNSLQLLLNAPSAGAPPAITASPQPTVVAAGRTARLTVTASGENLTYQWRRNGQNLPDGGNISGARSATLNIGSFSEADEAVYSVAVFNPAGSALSRNAVVRLSEFNINELLVAYFPVNASTGTTVPNAVTGGTAGTIEGTPAWGAGRIGNALRFDGGTHVVVNNYPKAQRQLGVSAWVNVDASVAESVVFFRNALGGLAVGGGNSGQFTFGLVADPNDGVTRLSAAIAAGPNIVRATAPQPFTTGQWQHVAFSADGAQLRLYVNGQEVASIDYLAPFNTPQVQQLTIGAQLTRDLEEGVPGEPYVDFNNPQYLIGQIDDIAIWNRALSASEVALIHAAGAQGRAVTTVEVEQPGGVAEPGTLQVSASAGNITVTWDHGLLQTSSSVLGPWTDVTTQGNTFTEATSGEAKFYRTVSQ